MPLTASALLAKGYFPKELPPPFGTAALAAHLPAIESAGVLAGRATECVDHNLARVGGTRRPLRIPNPRSFTLLARELEQQWATIDRHLGSADLAISRPVVTRTRERAVRPRFHIREMAHQRALTWPGRRFVLRTDVSQFYASIYTHSIPWALHSKATAKAKKGKTKGDRIDKAIRDCVSGQTAGVPIGPDTSLVVAEVVLTAVDKAFRRRMRRFRGFRYLDDYELAFESRGHAEEGLALLELSLGQFELVPNPHKTAILELPQPFKDNWTTELAKLPIRDDSPLKTESDLISLMSRAAELAQTYPGALNYALTKSREVPIVREVWPVFQSLVWSAVSSEPTAMATALDLLQVKADEAGSTVNRSPATEVAEAIIRRHAPIRNASEVAWALWAVITLKLKLGKGAAKQVAAVDDDFVALLALDARARGCFPVGALDDGFWAGLVAGEDAFLADHWLLAYEGAASGWMPAAAKQLEREPFFKLIQSAGVRFYDPNPSREPFTGPAGPLPGGLDTYG